VAGGLQVKLVKLRIQGLRVFEDVTINFPDSGLMLVRGDSGTGKSSIFLALAYVLDILPPGFSATSLQSWSGTPLQVDLEAEENGVIVKMGRGKKTYVQVGETVTSGAAAVAELRQKVLGLPTEILRALTYRAQKQPGPLLAMTDAQKKDFLTTVLNLGGLEEAVSAAEDKLRDLKPKKEALTGSLSTAVADLQRLESDHVETLIDTQSLIQQKSLEEKALESAKVQQHKTLEASAANIARAKQCLDSSDASIKEITAGIKTQIATETKELEQKLEQCRQFLQNVKVEDDARHKKHQDDVRGYNSAITDLEIKLRDCKKQASCIPALEAELQKSVSGMCPTCMQTWCSSGDHCRRLQSLIQEARRYEALVPEYEVRLQAARADLAKMVWAPDPNIEKLTIAREAIYSDIQTIRVRAEASESLKAATDIRKQRYQEYCQSQQESIEAFAARKEVDSSFLRLKDVSNSISSTEARNLSASRFNQQRQNRISEAKKRLQGLESELETVTKNLNSELDFIDCLGRTGFLGVIFDDILREIAAATNARLARFNNTAGITVDFRTETQTQKGKVNKTIAAVFNVNGHEGSFETGLSGGQQTSVEQALDLAMTEVIQARSGKMPGFLMLDEPFHGQPLPVKEAALEIIKEASQNKLVIVVDHEDSFKEQFSMVLSVKSNNGVSEVVQ
jgi:DNA repair exonuclease SbcCD ATPase subunit